MLAALFLSGNLIFKTLPRYANKIFTEKKFGEKKHTHRSIDSFRMCRVQQYSSPLIHSSTFLLSLSLSVYYGVNTKGYRKIGPNATFLVVSHFARWLYMAHSVNAGIFHIFCFVLLLSILFFSLCLFCTVVSVNGAAQIAAIASFALHLNCVYLWSCDFCQLSQTVFVHILF